MKKVNKQWSDIWIEEDGIHMLKMACDRVFKENKPDYIGDDYVIKFENVKKLKKLDYKQRVMLVKLKESDVEFEVPVNYYEEYMTLKTKMLHKTVGTKRKTALVIAFGVLCCLLAGVNYNLLFNKLEKSIESIDLQKSRIEYVKK